MKRIKRLISLLLTLSMLFGLGAQAWAETLTLPTALKQIQDEAFAGDTSLDKVVLPEGADSIGERAFADSSLREINLPASLTYIADDAFQGTKPTVTAAAGTYAYQWAAEHELIVDFVFNSHDLYDFTTVRAAFSDNEEIGLYHDSWVRNYQIANYDALSEIKEGEPEWSVAFVGEDYGATLQYVVGEWAGDGPGALGVLIENEPDFPCTLQFEVTCTWGGESITGTATLNYQQTALPTGFDAPEELHGLKIGEDYRCSMAVLPKGFAFGDYAYCELWTDMDCESWTEYADGKQVLCIHPNESGIAHAWLVYNYGNIQMRKWATLYVADETGKVAAAPRMDADYWFDMALSVENNNGYDVYLDNRTLGVNVWNMQILRELYGDDFEWSFRTLDGRPLDLSWEAYENYFEFAVNNLDEMSAGSQTLVEATLRWGEASAATSFHFSFGRLIVPEEIVFEQDISVTVGDVYRATVSIAPDAANFKHFLWYDVSDEDAIEKWNDEDRDACYLRANSSGYYAARPHIHACDNVYIWGGWNLLTVYNKDGSIQDPVPFFLLESGDRYEVDYMLGDFETPDGEGWFSSSFVFGWVLDNLSQLYRVYGDDPEIVWSVEHTGGMEVALEAEPSRYDRYVGDACNVLITEMPEVPGYTEFNLYCDWNGHRGTLPCRIYINEKPQNLPQTNTFPDEITVGVGETVYVSGRYPEGAYALGEHYYWIDADESYVEIRRNPDEKGSVAVTGLQAGTITAAAKVGVSGNAFARKLITIHVEEEDIQKILSQLDREKLFIDESKLSNTQLIPEELAANDLELEEIREYNALATQENEQTNDLMTHLAALQEGFSGLQDEISQTSQTETDTSIIYNACGFTMAVDRSIADSGVSYDDRIEQARVGDTDYVILHSEAGDTAYLYILGNTVHLSGTSPEAPQAVPRGIADSLYDYFIAQIRELGHYANLIEEHLKSTLEFWQWKVNSTTIRVKWLEHRVADTTNPALRSRYWSELVNQRDELTKFTANRDSAVFWRKAWAKLDIFDSIGQLYTISNNWERINIISDHGHPRPIDKSYPDGVEMSTILNQNITSLRILYGTDVVGTLAQLVLACSTFLAAGGGPAIAVPLSLGTVLQGVMTAAHTRERKLLEPILSYDEILHTYVYGWVKDKETMKPLEKINVTDGHLGAWTDENGYYELHVDPGERTLYFSHDNYEKGKLKVSVTSGEANLADDMLMEHKPNIQGSVSDRDGKAIEGATVSCGSKTAVSDGEGRFSMYLEMGAYTLLCDKAGYIPKEEPVTTSADGIAQVDFVLQPGIEIWNRQDLEAVAENPGGDYILCADIDLSGAPWSPLPWFSGNLYGRGFSIRGMRVEESSDGNAGLFAGLSGATVSNLTISGASVEVSVDASYTNTGVLCGNMVKSATVSDSTFSGTIIVSDGTVNGSVFTGGISGLGNYGCLADCQSNVSIEVNYKNSMHVGGLFGQMNSGSISRCAYNGTLRASQSGKNAGAQIVAAGIGFAGSITGLYCTVGGSVSASSIDGEVLAYGLMNAYHGENHASVSAASDQGRAFAVGVQDSTYTNNYGGISAKSSMKNADAAGVNSSVSCDNHGSITGTSVYGDTTAVGVVDSHGCVNYGGTYAYSAYGNAYYGSYPYGYNN